MDKFLEAAIEEARKGLDEGGIPIGSVLVHEGEIIGRGHNRRMQNGSVVLHGEMDALENAGRLPAKTYRESTIYTTLSPCPMCSGAILLYGIPREDWLEQKGVTLERNDNAECKALMQTFITAHPDEWNEDIGES